MLSGGVLDAVGSLGTGPGGCRGWPATGHHRVPLVRRGRSGGIRPPSRSLGSDKACPAGRLRVTVAAICRAVKNINVMDEPPIVQLMRMNTKRRGHTPQLRKRAQGPPIPNRSLLSWTSALDLWAPCPCASACQLYEAACPSSRQTSQCCQRGSGRCAALHWGSEALIRCPS